MTEIPDHRGGSKPESSDGKIEWTVGFDADPTLPRALQQPRQLVDDLTIEIVGDRYSVGQRGLLFGPHDVAFLNDCKLVAGGEGRDETLVDAFQQLNIQIQSGETVETTGILGGRWQGTIQSYGQDGSAFAVTDAHLEPYNPDRPNDAIDTYGGTIVLHGTKVVADHAANLVSDATIVFHDCEIEARDALVDTGIGGGTVIFSGHTNDVDAPQLLEDDRAPVEVRGRDRVDV
jgi:hypothetical protein